MDVRNLIIGLGSFAVVAGAALAGFWFLRSPTTDAGSHDVEPLQSILVAARPLVSGTLLKDADTAWKKVTPSNVRPTNIVLTAESATEFVGAVTRRDFAAGESLVAGDLVKAVDLTFLSATLLSGSRAVSIAVDAPQSAAGLLQPGDRVDVILTQSFDESGGAARKAVSETILQNIRVIAIDQWLNTGAKGARPEARLGDKELSIPKTVTLEVSGREAERLLVALELGKIQLSVRALQGAEVSSASADARVPAEIWASDVSPALQRIGRPLVSAGMAPPLAGVPAAEKSRSFTEVMRGSKSDAR